MEPVNQDEDINPHEIGWHYATIRDDGSIYTNFYIGDKKPETPDKRFTLLYFFQGFWYWDEPG